MDNPLDTANPNRKYVLIVYVLQALAFIGLFFAPVMGVIVNYIKLDDVRGSWLESHFRWQIRSFWYGLLWTVLASLTLPIFGWLLWAAMSVWYFYRIAKGWIYYADGKEMYR